jgi:hypothetical protein
VRPGPSALQAECGDLVQVYAHTLGVHAADDLKYVYGLQLLQAVLEVMRAKAIRPSLDDVQVGTYTLLLVLSHRTLPGMHVHLTPAASPYCAVPLPSAHCCLDCTVSP